jgi:hypothetical protein
MTKNVSGVVASVAFAAGLVVLVPSVNAQDKAPGTPPPAATKADAQRVVKIIQADKAKSKNYCDLATLGDQIEQAYEKKDEKAVDALSQKMDDLGANIGPEYVALMDSMQDMDPNSTTAQEIGDVFGPLDDMCGKK